MLIIYLNFLIAIISDSFNKVMEQKVIKEYEAKCQVNHEMTLNIQYFDQWFEDFVNAKASVFTLLCPDYKNETVKLVNSIVAPLKAEMRKLGNQFRDVKKEI